LIGIRGEVLWVEPGAARLHVVDLRAEEAAWAREYIRQAGVVDLHGQDIDAGCLRLLNRRQAWQFHLLPLRRRGKNLHLGTDAANLLRAAKFAMRKFNEPVCLVIAQRRQLRQFLMKHYPVPLHLSQYADKM